ncbi:hypothetical protein CEN44_28935 [Fischerella muscicola CCMEE 5323]|uniref:Uncharacterized protein n=1 Tax=Fischerella muscicola CCMEE 5323 TaxID=2019572 RepID=A0A2N6JUG9_FISMU|nr:hypothetical protein CEN44_28935 [Fischerella muscicola CCMEE 5323]
MSASVTNIIKTLLDYPTGNRTGRVYVHQPNLMVCFISSDRLQDPRLFQKVGDLTTRKPSKLTGLTTTSKTRFNEFKSLFELALAN